MYFLRMIWMHDIPRSCHHSLPNTSCELLLCAYATPPSEKRPAPDSVPGHGVRTPPAVRHEPPPAPRPLSHDSPTTILSGSRLMPEGAEALMVERVFPRATMITPNLVEAETLLGRSLRTPADVEAGAASLLSSSGAGGVLIKGGHSSESDEADDETDDDSAEQKGAGSKETAKGEAEGKTPERYSQDYWTDGTPGGSFWLTAPRVDSDNTHGTGCTLSSAAAACLAAGLDPADSVVIAKAYVTQGIRAAQRFGKGPGPVAHTGWPSRADCFPWVTSTAERGAEGRPQAFPRCHDDWGLYPVVETAEW